MFCVCVHVCVCVCVCILIPGGCYHPWLTLSVLIFNIKPTITITMGFPGGSVIRNLPANAEDVMLIPGLGRSPGEGNGNPLQYSCPRNSMNRGALGLKATGLP